MATESEIIRKDCVCVFATATDSLCEKRRQGIAQAFSFLLFDKSEAGDDGGKEGIKKDNSIQRTIHQLSVYNL